jgi:hypothetical protein
LRRSISIAILAGAALHATVARADDSKDAERSKLEQDLTDLRARMAKQEEELAKLREEREKPALVRFSGWAHVDWVVSRQSSQDEVNGATGEPLNESRFMLRRGRLRADMERGVLSGALEIDANTVRGPQVRPLEALASLRWPPDKKDGEIWIMTTIGLFHTPFGFEARELDRNRPFLERTTGTTALFTTTPFDLGLRVQGGWRFLSYALGLMNGSPLGDRAFPGRDPNESKDLVAHVGVDTKVADPVRVEAGVSWLSGSGFHKGTPSTKDMLVWRDVNEDGIVQPTEVQAIAGSAATPSENFRRFALGADLRVHVEIPVLGELCLRTEIIRAKNLDRALLPADPVASGRDLRELGYYVGFTQDVTRYGIVGLRYDYYDPDTDASEQRGIALVPKDASFTTVSIMGAVRYPVEKDGVQRYAGRLIVQYDHNTNALGRGSNGLPTTLADDAFTLRGEVSF